MRRFIWTILKFSIVPFVVGCLFLLGYWHFDPFKVLRTYADFSKPVIVPNRDYVSTETFIRNNPHYHYNSFIFGSSRTMAFKPARWKKYLPQDAEPFLFDASNESIYGIYTKIKWLDQQGIPLKNVLLLICHDRTFTHSSNVDSHLYIKHPAVSGESMRDFQWLFFKAYIQPDFWIRFYGYQLLGYQSWMKGFIQEKPIFYDTRNNTIYMPFQERLVSQHPDEYYKEKKGVFYQRKGQKIDKSTIIEYRQEKMLQEIATIFKKHHTNYKIILSPLYEQVKFHPNDLAILQKLFPKRVYDFTGKNGLTSFYQNYYEQSHFRTGVGDAVMKKVYLGKGKRR